MAFLVDTNVLSEQLKAAPCPTVLEWLRVNQAELFTSTVTIGELSFGIECLPEGQRKERYRSWLIRLNEIMKGRILSYNRASAHIWGQMQADLRAKGHQLPKFDLLIAAIAKRNGLTIATRNVSDFESTGIKICNPFES